MSPLPCTLPRRVYRTNTSKKTLIQCKTWRSSNHFQPCTRGLGTSWKWAHPGHHPKPVARSSLCFCCHVHLCTLNAKHFPSPLILYLPFIRYYDNSLSEIEFFVKILSRHSFLNTIKTILSYFTSLKFTNINI